MGSEDVRHPLDELAEDFLVRYRRGERPALSEYAERHPALADEIRELFPALVLMEAVGRPETPLSPPSVQGDGGGKVGQRLGDYRVLGEVGRGGMGVVYEAVHEALGRHVALKVLPPEASADPRRLERFRREARAAARLHHTNIVPVFDVGESQGLHYYAMQFIQGRPLNEVLAGLRRDEQGQGVGIGGSGATVCWEPGSLPPDRPAPGEPSRSGTAPLAAPAGMPRRPGASHHRTVALLGRQVAEALAHAHGQKVLHRDIKPANLLLDTQGNVWVADFGLAWADDAEALTRTGDLVGTLRYMPPERFRGVSDARGDIYALGLTLYELLTLRPAFDESDRGRLIRQLTESGPAAPRTLDPRIPRDLETVVLKAIAREPEHRYQTADEMAEDLRLFLADRPIQARRVSWREHAWRWVRRNPLPSGLAAVATVLLVVSLISVGISRVLRRDRDLAVAAQERAEAAEARALKAEREVTIRSHLANAAAIRNRGQAGQRFGCLAELRKALALDPSPALRDEIRTEAIAALALPDLEVAREWEGWPEGTGALDFDDTLERFVRLDKQGGLAVCRLTPSGEEVLARIPAPGAVHSHGPWLSPDGRYVLVAHSPERESTAAAFCVWKLDMVWKQHGAEPVPVLQTKASVYEFAVAFRPGSHQLAIGHADKSVSVYDLESRRRLRTFDVNALPFRLAFNPSKDGRLAVACGNRVRIFDVDRDKEHKALVHPDGFTWTTGLAWHPDGRRLATACNRSIFLWDANTASTLTPPWEGHTSEGINLAFNHAGDRLVSHDWGVGTRLWDALTGRQLVRSPHGIGVRFRKDDALLGGSAHAGSKVRLYRIAAGRELRAIRPAGAKYLIDHLALDADGGIVAAGSYGGLGFFDLASGEELATLRLPATTFAIPSGCHRTTGWLITLVEEGVKVDVRFWPSQPDLNDPRTQRIGPPRALAVAMDGGAQLSADARLVAIPMGNQGALVKRLDSPGKDSTFGPQHDVRYVALSPDGRWLVTCSHHAPQPPSSSVRIWDVAGRKHLHDLPLPNLTTAAFSANGRWLATYPIGFGCKVWEVKTWKELRHFGNGHFAFSPDSQLLALSDVHGVVRLAEVESGREVARLTFPEPNWYPPRCFSPDGTYLVCSHGDGKALHVWNLRLLRAGLKEMGLDWDWPELPPRPALKPPPRRITIDPGNLIPAK